MTNQPSLRFVTPIDTDIFKPDGKTQEARAEVGGGPQESRLRESERARSPGHPLAQQDSKAVLAAPSVDRRSKRNAQPALDLIVVVQIVAKKCPETD